MYTNIPYRFVPHTHPHYYSYPYAPSPYDSIQSVPASYMNIERQQTIQGQATWTDGGQVTKCGIPWSANEYMTAAVSQNSPYRCGQMLKIVNPNNQRQIIVTIVDQVQGYPVNRINLHRRAFETLGANPQVGVLDIQITPSPQIEEEKWGKYLLEVTQTAYPNYNVTDYQSVEKTQISNTQIREVYDYYLQSPQELITVRGTVVYNPNTNRVTSFDIREM
ncbi:rare lipoprotein A [Salinibacillus kushneri]|uniref:Rare lipoprotein A n=1 Tax=Salinibacillus kushneri TaxID=237682 RepID=A0A1I0DTU3_9BACI|nr:DUF3889 domain-containing protein [Salinibacillus kushneri]SET35622.1 rare lipoprotein A [Salinibacillus kushneri]